MRKETIYLKASSGPDFIIMFQISLIKQEKIIKKARFYVAESNFQHNFIPLKP